MIDFEGWPPRALTTHDRILDMYGQLFNDSPCDHMMNEHRIIELEYAG